MDVARSFLFREGSAQLKGTVDRLTAKSELRQGRKFKDRKSDPGRQLMLYFYRNELFVQTYHFQTLSSKGSCL